MKKLILIILFIPLLANGQTSKNFRFDSSIESWVFNNVLKNVGSYNSTQQALEVNSVGRNNSELSYWEWTGSWEDLGVSSGNIITSVTIDYDWMCYVANVSDGYTVGPAEIWNSTGETLIGTSSTSYSGSGTTSFATRSGSSVSIGSTYQASSTTIKLRISVLPDNGNNTSAETGLYFDNIGLSISDQTPSTSRRIFIIN